MVDGRRKRVASRSGGRGRRALLLYNNALLPCIVLYPLFLMPRHLSSPNSILLSPSLPANGGLPPPPNLSPSEGWRPLSCPCLAQAKRCPDRHPRRLGETRPRRRQGGRWVMAHVREPKRRRRWVGSIAQPFHGDREAGEAGLNRPVGGNHEGTA